jgi:pyruvate,water dikinase
MEMCSVARAAHFAPVALLAASLLCLGGCRDGGALGDAGADARPDASADGAAPDGGSGPAFLDHLNSPADFLRLAGEEWAVKYLSAVGGAGGGTPLPSALASTCVLQNTARFPLHLGFLKSFPEYSNLDFASYLALTQKSASRTFFAGELKLLPGAVHPRTGARGVMLYFVYASEADPVTVEDLATVDARLKTCVPYARDLLVLVAMDATQEQSFAASAQALRARGVDFARHAELRPGVAAESYSAGESYGFLRLSPAGVSTAEAGPRDIVIAESASEETGLVAGLVTTLPQNIHSHLNLRLREKKIPNARVTDIFADQAIVNLDGRLAHLVVTDTEVKLTPALLDEAEAFWKLHRPAVQPLAANLTEVRVRGFAELAHADLDAYGAKAANLAELHQVLPAANRAEGFAIPFSAAKRFLDESGLAAEVEALLADPRTRSDALFRRSALKALRKSIEDRPLPLATVMALQAPAEAAFGANFRTEPTRFRSSSNVEDGEVSSGAGLYDSARGCFADDLDGDEAGPSACLSAAERAALGAELERRKAELAAHPERSWLPGIIDDLDKDLGKERSVARALKKVWASLWTDRAFEEREYFGMDQRKAAMAVAVNSSFVMEHLDAVAVTNLPVMAGDPLYRVVSQRDGQPVVRPPDPTLVAETLTFRRGPTGQVNEPTLVTRSSLSAGPLWTDAQRDTLAGLMFQVQDHFATKVYGHLPRLSLDLEIKLTNDDRVVIKQARPYIDVGP